jgi:hypothetical protein
MSVLDDLSRLALGTIHGDAWNYHLFYFIGLPLLFMTTQNMYLTFSLRKIYLSKAAGPKILFREGTTPVLRMTQRKTPAWLPYFDETDS